MVAGALVVPDGLGEPLVRVQAGGAHPRSAAARSSAASSRRPTPRPRAPLTVWFAVCWAFASQRDGVSALGLRRTLEIGSYQTAWTMLHRLRAGMVRPGRDRLTGTVEMDGTLIGGVTPGKRGRQGRECWCHRAQGAEGLRSVAARRRSTSRGFSSTGCSNLPSATTQCATAGSSPARSRRRCLRYHHRSESIQRASTGPESSTRGERPADQRTWAQMDSLFRRILLPDSRPDVPPCRAASSRCRSQSSRARGGMIRGERRAPVSSHRRDGNAHLRKDDP